jgi:hypothetical protein
MKGRLRWLALVLIALAFPLLYRGGTGGACAAVGLGLVAAAVVLTLIAY